MITRFVKELPPFFCLDSGSLEEMAQTDPRRAPGIIIQRYILNSLIHAQRCELHLPYLARGSTEPAYVYSPFVSTRLKFSGTLYDLSLASIVLLLNLCLNQGANEEACKGEGFDACRILEEARGQSATATKLLDSLMHVLRRHKVLHPALEVWQPAQGNENQPATMPNEHQSSLPTPPELTERGDAEHSLQEEALAIRCLLLLKRYGKPSSAERISTWSTGTACLRS